MNKQAKLQHLKDLLVIANDAHVKKAVKENAWDELWKELETPVKKIVNQTISKFYHHNRPSSDLVSDAVFESILWLITNAKSWDPKRGALPSSWAYKKIAQITMSLVGLEHVTLDVDESTEAGALKKQELEMRLYEESVAGRTSGTTYAGDFEVEHPFDQLANLNNPDVSLLLEALQYLLFQNLITDDGAAICAERIIGTEYSILAEYFGKTEEATRKLAERTNRQLKKLNLEMPRYADLIKIPMIAAVVNGKASKKGK
jgi:hypothetical protein